MHDQPRPFQRNGPIPPDRSGVERIKGVPRPDLFRAAIEHLLTSLSPRDITPDDVEVIERRYGIQPEDRLDLRTSLWCDALEALLAAGGLSAYDQEYLRNLQAALELADEDVETVRLRTVAPVFKSALKAAVADKALSPSEREELAHLASRLGLSPQIAARAVDMTARSLLDQVWRSATRDRVLTEADAGRLREAAAALGIALTPDQERVVSTVEAHALEQRRIEAERRRKTEEKAAMLRAATDKLRQAARLPKVGASTRLDEGEVCYCVEQVELYEMMPDPHNRFYAHQLTFQDAGALHLTNRRVLFVGPRRHFSIPIEAIDGVTQYLDALCFKRGLDKEAFFIMDLEERVDLVAVVIARIKKWSDLPRDAQYIRPD